MAEDGGGTFDQPKVGRKKLPKGQGDLKTNSQVFGLIGQQVMRINKLTSAIDSGNAALVNTLESQLNQSNQIAGSQLKVLDNIQAILGTIGTSLAPLATLATEQNEGSVIKKQGMMAGIAGFFSPGKDSTNEINNNVKAVNNLSKAYKNLNQQTGALTGLGVGGGIIGATVGGAAGALGRVGVLGGAAIGGTFGLIGGGLLVLTGAMYAGARAVDIFGEALPKVADGLERLDTVRVTKENFVELNQAINALNNDISRSEARAFNIFSKSAFVNVAEGIETLNNTEVDTALFDDIGSAIENLVGDMTLGGSLGLRIFEGTAFNKLKEGIEVLNGVKIDAGFANMMGEIGQGIGDFTSNSYNFWSGTGGVNVVSKLNNVDLQKLADGINHLNSIEYNEKLSTNLANAGTAIDGFLDPLTGYFSGNKNAANILQTLGERSLLKGLADGLTELNNLPNKGTLKENLTLIGDSVEAMLDGFRNAKAAGVLTDLTLEDFTELIDGMEALQAMVNKPIDLIDSMGKKVGSVRSGDLLKSDFETLGQSLAALLDGLEKSKVKSLTQLVGTDGFFDANALIELEDGINQLNQLPAIKSDNFEAMGKAIYSLVSNAAGKTTAEELREMQDEDWWTKSLLVFDNSMGYLAGIFDRKTELEKAANGMAGMSFVLRSFDEVDEPMLKNFVDASKGVADVMNTLSDENIVGQANYKKLDKFVKAIDRLNPIRLKQVSDLTDALGIAVEGGNISAQQVDALKSSVVQQILRASIVDSSSQNNIQQNNSSRVSNFGGGSSASFVPVSVFVSK